MRRCRVLLSGVRRALLARARPSSAVRSVTPLASMGCCSPLSAVGLARLTRIRAPLSIGQHSPAHAPRGRAAKPIASTSCIDLSHRQGIAPSLLGLPRPLASSPLGCSRASGGRRSARTGPPRSFLPIAALTVPRRAGAEIRPRTSPLEEAHAPSTRPWPVECTGQPTQPSNRRPSLRKSLASAAYCCAAWFAC